MLDNDHFTGISGGARNQKMRAWFFRLAHRLTAMLAPLKSAGRVTPTIPATVI
jgi:hypothetical protein